MPTSDRDETPVQEAGTAADDTATIKLVTVHGTGAGDTTASGDRWWQLGSRFERELMSRLETSSGRIELAPFQWDEGPNSENDRREAGAKLLKQLRSHEKAGVPYHLIGHSHGGSVIYCALLQAVQRGINLPNLRQWYTVGTPFLHYQPNKRLWQRLSTAGLTFFLSGIVAWLIVLSYLVALYVTGWTTAFTQVVFLRNFAIVLATYGVLCIVALQLWERRNSKGASSAEREQVETEFGSRWTGYWHAEDEAISALINVGRVTGPIVPATFLQPIVAGLQFAIILGLGLLVAYDTIRNGSILEFLVDDLYFLAGLLSDTPQTLNAVLFGLVCSLFLLVSCLILAAAWILKKILLLVGIPLSRAINKVIWRSVRDRAWGDDLTQEGVHGVGAAPPLFRRSFGPLPEAIAAPLRMHSDSNAIETLNKVRLILGMTRDQSPSSDIKTELAESLGWKELIHTSYFDVPEFVDLIAKGFAHRDIAFRATGFSSSADDLAEMDTWLDSQAEVLRQQGESRI
jgi:hypothetical protein